MRDQILDYLSEYWSNSRSGYHQPPKLKKTNCKDNYLNMKKVGCFLAFIFLCNLASAQKKILSLEDTFDWPALTTDQQISNDGKYIYFSIKSEKNQFNMVKSVSGNWERKITGGKDVLSDSKFTEDNRHLIFINGDSLAILDLKKDSIQYIADVSTFQVPEGGTGEWLVCGIKSRTEMLLLNLWTGEQKNYTGITQKASGYKFNRNGTVLLVRKEDQNANQCLLWIDLPSRREKVIVQNRKIGQLLHFKYSAFNNNGDQVVFTTKATNSEETDLRVYSKGMDSARILINASSGGLKDLTINLEYVPYFSDDDKRIFFYTDDVLEKKGLSRIDHKNLEIRRHYTEKRSPFTNTNQIYTGPYLATFELETGKAERIQLKGEEFIKGNLSSKTILLFRNSVLNKQQQIDQLLADRRFDIILLKFGAERVTIKKDVRLDRFLRPENVGLSPTSRYAYWFDMDKKNWFVYDLRNRTTMNFTGNISVPLTRKPSGYYDDDLPCSKIMWTNQDSAMLIQDRHSDLWRIGLLKKEFPVNITGGYAQRNSLQFTFLGQLVKNSPLMEDAILTDTDTLLFYTFNWKTKETGFFKLPFITKVNSPIKAVMNANIYSKPIDMNNFGEVRSMLSPTKAKSANVYLVRKMSTSEAPNIYVTNDFKTYRSLSNIQPHKAFNWYTTELHHWKLPDGTESSGILYKPENFDPTKKYPVIFAYYEKGSGGLNAFVNHSLSQAAFPIPLFVSNGYLIFVPDIFYRSGNPGVSATNTVVSAANYLSRLPFVDKRHMGIQGHSFAGYATNHIVSHSKIFAAAAESAGVSNLVSNYSTDQFPGGVYFYYETGQGRMGKRFGLAVEDYLKNSPILYADKVTTPLLIMHNKNDTPVEFSEGLHWYNMLVRGGKRVWMLSYKNENHNLSDPINKYDYTNKLLQFFDHFLKGKAKPDWM